MSKEKKSLICILLHGGLSHRYSRSVLYKIKNIPEITKIQITNQKMKHWIQNNNLGIKITEIPCFLLKVGNKTDVVLVDQIEYIQKMFNK